MKALGSISTRLATSVFILVNTKGPILNSMPALSQLGHDCRCWHPLLNCLLCIDCFCSPCPLALFPQTCLVNCYPTFFFSTARGDIPSLSTCANFSYACDPSTMQSELGHMGGASNGLISKMQLSQTATFTCSVVMVLPKIYFYFSDLIYGRSNITITVNTVPCLSSGCKYR